MERPFREQVKTAELVSDESSDVAAHRSLPKSCPCCQRYFSSESPETVCPEDSSLLVPLSSPLTGTTIDGKYRVEHLLASGAWSEVFLASHDELDKKVAIKVLHLNLVSEPARVRRFEEEARNVSRLHDPGIVSVHDFGLTADGRPYMVMDYIEGVSLSEATKQRLLDPLTATHLCIQLASALQTAHEHGIIHRDVKPANVMLSENEGKESCFILDFGVAKTIMGEQKSDVTRTGEVLGTPAYMSPEQCRSQALDARSDIYSLGCVFYEMLTGERLVKGDNSFVCMKWHMEGMPPEITGEHPIFYSLSSIVLKMLEKKPEHRYQSMSALVADLQDALSGAVIVPPARKMKIDKRYLLMLILPILACLFFLIPRGSGPVLVPEHPPNAIERNALKKVAEKTLADKLENGFRDYIQQPHFKEKKKYFEDLFARRTPLPKTDVPQEMMVSVLEPITTKLPVILGDVDVDVTYTQGPVSLVLHSPYPVKWKVHAASGVNLVRVVLEGDAKSTVQDLPSDIEVMDHSGADARIANSPLENGLANQSFLRKTGAGAISRFGMTWTTFQVKRLGEDMKFEVGPGDKEWLSEYILRLMKEDEVLGPAF